MRTVIMTRPAFVGSRHHAEGEVIQLDEHRASALVRQGLAENAAELPAADAGTAEDDDPSRATDPKRNARRAVKPK